MDPFTALILELAKQLGLPPVTIALLIPLTITVANRIAKLIPDTATGWLKYVRVAFAILGVNVKDNSGVPAIQQSDGGVIRRSAPDTIPESIDEELQGALALDERVPVIPPMFRAANAAIQERNYHGEG